jgi:hypothetical protein
MHPHRRANVHRRIGTGLQLPGKSATTRKYCDTYSSIIRLACVEYDLSVTDPGQATSKALAGTGTETEGVRLVGTDAVCGGGGGAEQIT